MSHFIYRTCSLCEAGCGLTLEVEGDRIVDVRPDADDVFSRGHVCPKGLAMPAVHDDPDRLRTPMRRNDGGTFEPISWGRRFGEGTGRGLRG